MATRTSKARSRSPECRTYSKKRKHSRRSSSSTESAHHSVRLSTCKNRQESKHLQRKKHKKEQKEGKSKSNKKKRKRGSRQSTNDSSDFNSSTDSETLRSVISGKRIKRKIKQSAADLQHEQKRQQLLQFYNGIYD